MMRPLKLGGILLLWLALLPSGGVAAALSDGTGDPAVTLEAGELTADHRNDLFEGSGAAQLTRDGMTLRAEKVWFDRKADFIGADGRIVMEEDGNRLEGEDLVVRLSDRTARLSRGKARFAGQNFRLAGEEIARIGENSYRIERGTFTVCSDDPPAWKFGASQVDVELGGYARAKHVLFYLHDIPVFYLPYFLYPAKTERESGFLVPHFGFSRLRGWEVGMAYYQVLGRNQDATFFLDTFSLAGIGKGVEYRYIFGDDNAGTTALYHVSGFEERPDVYAGRWKHSGTLPGDFRLSTDLEFVSDQEYLTDYATVSGEYNRQLVESYLTLSRGWKKADLALQGAYLKDFSADSVVAPSHLPEVYLSLLRQRIAGTPLYWQFDARGDQVVSSGTTVGRSLTLRPQVAFSLQPVKGINLDGDGWFLSYTGTADAATRNTILSGGQLRLSSSLQRIFQPDDERRLAVRHTIEPEVGFRFVAEEDQAERVVMAGDLPDAEERVTFALTNRLNSRRVGEENSAPVFLEWLFLKLSSSYDVRDEPLDVHRLAPLRTEAIIRPASWLTLTGDARFPLSGVDRQWETVTLGIAAARERVGELSLNYVAPAFGVDEYISARILLPVVEQVNFSYQTRLTMEENRFLEHLATVEYLGQCWSISFTYHERPNDEEYLVNFNLAGLGKNSGYGSRGGN